MLIFHTADGKAMSIPWKDVVHLREVDRENWPGDKDAPEGAKTYVAVKDWSFKIFAKEDVEELASQKDVGNPKILRQLHMLNSTMEAGNDILMQILRNRGTL